MASPREVDESPVYQGEDESKAYTFNFANYGTPTSPTVIVKDYNLVDVSATCLSGSASIVGDTVVTPLVTALTAGIIYRLECKVTISSNVRESFCMIIAEE